MNKISNTTKTGNRSRKIIVAGKMLSSRKGVTFSRKYNHKSLSNTIRVMVAHDTQLKYPIAAKHQAASSNKAAHQALKKVELPQQLRHQYTQEEQIIGLSECGCSCLLDTGSEGRAESRHSW